MPLFYEEQPFRQLRLRILTAIPPVVMTLLAIWQVGLGHRLGKEPMSNGSLIGWSVFLWIVYLRLITVKLVTELRPGELRVRMRGLWRSHSIPLSDIKSVNAITFDAARDWGGYGIRSTRRGTAYLAGGDHGAELEMKNGSVVLIGSRRSGELALAIAKQDWQTKAEAPAPQSSIAATKTGPTGASSADQGVRPTNCRGPQRNWCIVVH
jgi:hypothetical protein